MGWVESPPSFCAVTETIADVVNHHALRPYAPPHLLERIASTPSQPNVLSNMQSPMHVVLQYPLLWQWLT